MIAKLIVWDESRDAARARLLQALAEYRVVGVTSNVGFLSRLTACPAFTQADLDTGLIERERAFLFPPAGEAPRTAWLLAALGELLRDQGFARAHAHGADRHSPWHLRDGWRMNGSAQREIRLRHGEVERSVFAQYAGSAYTLSLDDQTTPAAGTLEADGSLHAALDGRRLRATLIAAGEKRHVFFDGLGHIFAAIDPLFHAGEGAGSEGGLAAPMPGKVIALLAQSGAQVAKGTPLLILEAMKMEHTIAAPTDGKVEGFRFAVGDQVGDGDTLVEFAAAKPAA